MCCMSAHFISINFHRDAKMFWIFVEASRTSGKTKRVSSIFKFCFKAQREIVFKNAIKFDGCVSGQKCQITLANISFIAFIDHC